MYDNEAQQQDVPVTVTVSLRRLCTVRKRRKYLNKSFL
jgi:hypothetical protein